MHCNEAFGELVCGFGFINGHILLEIIMKSEEWGEETGQLLEALELKLFGLFEFKK